MTVSQVASVASILLLSPATKMYIVVARDSMSNIITLQIWFHFAQSRCICLGVYAVRSTSHRVMFTTCYLLMGCEFDSVTRFPSTPASLLFLHDLTWCWQVSPNYHCLHALLFFFRALIGQSSAAGQASAWDVQRTSSGSVVAGAFIFDK